VNRAFWFAAGAVTGVYGLVKVRRTVEKFSPDGVGARVAALRIGARMFADEVHMGMTERETELLQELRASAAQPPAITATTTGDAVEQATREGITDGHR
jgi:uncharacterized protein DUF6167